MYRFTRLACLSFFLCVTGPVSAQDDSLRLTVSFEESETLQDLMMLENIKYRKYTLSGNVIPGKYLVITREAYWEGSAGGLDTLVNTRLFGLQVSGEELHMRIMSKKINKDTMRIQFRLPWFVTYTDLPVQTRDDYTLTDLTGAGSIRFHYDGKPFTLMVLSLPYEDPERPGYKLYCELSADGIPPESWYEQFKVSHYVIFRAVFVE